MDLPPPELSAYYADIDRPPLEGGPRFPRPGLGVTDDDRVYADFAAGNVEVKLRLGLNNSLKVGPLSVFTWFLGWTELALCVDAGVYSFGDFTIGLGAEAHYARALLLEGISALLNLLPGTETHWRGTDAGFTGRVSMHYNRFRTFDAYAVGLVGPSWNRLSATAVIGETVFEGYSASGGLRLGLGAGISGAAPSGLMGGIEARYLVGYRFRKDEAITMTSPDGTEETLFELSGFMRPPNGFSLVGFIGWRF